MSAPKIATPNGRTVHIDDNGGMLCGYFDGELVPVPGDDPRPLCEACEWYVLSATSPNTPPRERPAAQGLHCHMIQPIGSECMECGELVHQPARAD